MGCSLCALFSTLDSSPVYCITLYECWIHLSLSSLFYQTLLTPTFQISFFNFSVSLKHALLCRRTTRPTLFFILHYLLVLGLLTFSLQCMAAERGGRYPGHLAPKRLLLNTEDLWLCIESGTGKGELEGKLQAEKKCNSFVRKQLSDLCHTVIEGTRIRLLAIKTFCSVEGVEAHYWQPVKDRDA